MVPIFYVICAVDAREGWRVGGAFEARCPGDGVLMTPEAKWSNARR